MKPRRPGPKERPSQGGVCGDELGGGDDGAVYGPPPFEFQGFPGHTLVVVYADGVLAGFEGEGDGVGGGAAVIPVVDALFAVEAEGDAVVAGDVEGVVAVEGDDEFAGVDDAEPLGGAGDFGADGGVACADVPVGGPLGEGAGVGFCGVVAGAVVGVVGGGEAPPPPEGVGDDGVGVGVGLLFGGGGSLDGGDAVVGALAVEGGG